MIVLHRNILTPIFVNTRTFPSGDTHTRNILPKDQIIQQGRFCKGSSNTSTLFSYAGTFHNDTNRTGTFRTKTHHAHECIDNSRIGVQLRGLNTLLFVLVHV